MTLSVKKSIVRSAGELIFAFLRLSYLSFSFLFFLNPFSKILSLCSPPEFVFFLNCHPPLSKWKINIFSLPLNLKSHV